MSLRVTILNTTWPDTSHALQSGNIVQFLLSSELARTDLEISMLRVCTASNATAPSPTARENLEAAGITLLGECVIPDFKGFSTSTAGYLFASPEDFYPAARYSGLVWEKLKGWKPDVVLVMWTEWLTALAVNLPCKTFAYYGNPDPKPARASLAMDRRFNPLPFRKDLKARLRNSALERAHLSYMRRVEWLGDVAANDALYYQNKGIRNAFYIQNCWIDRFPDWEVADIPDSTIRIAASIGKLSATANQHGFEIIANHLLPELRKQMAGRAFELHIYGAHEPRKDIARLLEQPEIVRRGFVDDIDKELHTKHAFLCANNVSAYNVGHTRYLHAWSLKCCVVAYSAASLAMPEIQDGVSALLGDTHADVARRLVEAATNAELRRKIGRGGYDTFRRYFTADKVAASIRDHLLRA